MCEEPPLKRICFDEANRKKGELVLPTVAVIVPVHNSEEYLDELFQSLLAQTYSGAIEVSLFDDRSSDASVGKITGWKRIIETSSDKMVVIFSQSEPGCKYGGPGYARNKAIEQAWLKLSHAQIVCGSV